MIDSKIEKLLITYKQKDEQAKRRAGNIDAEKALGKKNLLDKFGFSDDEESEIAQQNWRLQTFNIKNKLLHPPH